MVERRALLELTRARVLLFVREPEALFWVILFPVIMSVVLGFGFRDSGLSPSRVGLVEGPSLEAVARTLEAREDITLLRFEDTREARHKLGRSALDALLLPGEPASILFDAERAEGEAARLRIRDALVEREPSMAPREERISATGSRYIDFLFPGLLGMNLMGTGLWGIGFALVDQRQKKLLKRLLMTPMRRSSFLASFALSRFVFLVVEVGVLMLFGALVMNVPLAGSWAAFGLVLMAGALAFAAVGLLVASRARTIEGISGLLNFVMMPMWLCSGIFFSYERFPDVLHGPIRALPLTALNDALRGVMLDGLGVLDIVPQLLVLALWCVVAFTLALRIFRWD